jgi:hypothetical protein
MIMYKIQSETIKNTITGALIPLDETNIDYQQFIQDVAEQGIDIVEGPDVTEPSYTELRAQEYPSYADQFDKIYHEGVEAWKTEVQAIKDKYPKTITGGTTIGEVPAWVQEATSNWIFNKQLREYVAAVERLEHYILSEGRPEIREDVVVETKEVWNEESEEYETVNITENVITQTAIEPLEATVEVTEYEEETMESTTTTVRNPLIVRDEEERAAAQATISSTPQEVINAFGS